MKKPFWKRLLAVFFSLLLLAVLGVFAWCMFDYYPAEPEAAALLGNPFITRGDGMILLLPEEPSEVGLIFYPGAKVEAEAYLPLLNRLREAGVTVALMELPFRLAFFAPNAADQPIAQLPEIAHWYISGHSLGGAFASNYAANHPEAVDGVILLAANLYGGYDAQKALLIYGTQDSLAEKLLGDAVHTAPIQGGNHAQFGNYGLQPGDAEALIPREDQQDQAAQAMLAFLFP